MESVLSQRLAQLTPEDADWLQALADTAKKVTQAGPGKVTVSPQELPAKALQQLMATGQPVAPSSPAANTAGDEAPAETEKGPDDTDRHIATRIRELRLARRWSQVHLATDGAFSLERVVRMESGDHIFTETELERLALAFNVPVEELLP